MYICVYVRLKLTWLRLSGATVHICTTAHLPRGMTPRFYVETWVLVEKLLRGTLLVAVVSGQFFCNQEPSFTTFLMFVFFSGDLKIAAGNFSKAEVLTSTLKLKSFSTRF